MIPFLISFCSRCCRRRKGLSAGILDVSCCHGMRPAGHSCVTVLWQRFCTPPDCTCARHSCPLPYGTCSQCSGHLHTLLQLHVCLPILLLPIVPLLLFPKEVGLHLCRVDAIKQATLYPGLTWFDTRKLMLHSPACSFWEQHCLIIAVAVLAPCGGRVQLCSMLVKTLHSSPGPACRRQSTCSLPVHRIWLLAMLHAATTGE